MTNNERNFDILMKLAVDKCMEDEIAEFDALDTSDITVTEKTRRKVMNTLRMKYLRESLGVQIMKRLIVACLAIVTVLFAAAMSIQPIRAAFWEAVVTWYEDYIAIRMEKDPEVDYPKVIEERILPENLPEGWRIEVFSEDKVFGVYHIYGPDGEYIVYNQIVVTDAVPWFNNKDCVVEEIMIKDNVEGYLLTYSDDDIIVYWIEQYEFSLSGRNVPKEQLLQIAKELNK